MTKLFKKFFIATLSFVMMIACAFTFTTYKASASTNADVPARTFSQSEISDFAAATGRRIASQYSGPSCLILDSQLFLVNNINITQNSTLNNIVFSDFLCGFAYAFGFAAGIIQDVDDTSILIEEILDEAELQIVVHVSDRTYVNLTTGEHSTTVTDSNFYNRLLDGNTYDLYGAIVWETYSQFYSLLYNLQASNYFSIYTFPKDEINFGTSGLIVSAWLGGDDFTD